MADLKTYEGWKEMARGCLFFLEPRNMAPDIVSSSFPSTETWPKEGRGGLPHILRGKVAGGRAVVSHP